MTVKMYFFILLLFVSLVETSCHEVNVTEPNKLEQLLCNGELTLHEDTVLSLSNKIVHYIKGNVSTCFINTNHSLTLASNSSLPATIQCIDSPTSQPATGFIFDNMYKLTLHRLVIINCGGMLPSIELMNSTFCPNTQYLSAVFLFLHIKSLLIQEVSITGYYGFAIIAINPMNAVVNTVNVHCTNQSYGIESGILLLYTDNMEHTPVSSNLSYNTYLKNAFFEYNFGVDTKNQCLADMWYMIKRDSCFRFINAAGLTIIYTQTKFNASVLIQDTRFERNGGKFSGAILILHYNSGLGKTVINRTNFSTNNIYNSKSCNAFGSNLALVMLNASGQREPLSIEYSSFDGDNKNLPHTSGAVFIGMYEPQLDSQVKVNFSNVSFFNFKISSTGTCLYAHTYFSEEFQHDALHIILENITAYQNSQATAQTWVQSSHDKVGHFTLINAKVLKLRGNNCFYNNSGSVFDITDTRIELAGILNFTKNRGEKGPAFKLFGNSHIHMGEESEVYFIENSAMTKGGAIYAYDYSSNQCILKTNSNKRTCRLHFINNTAGESGSSIYSNNLYNCEASRSFRGIQEARKLYKEILNFTLSSVQNNISTFPVSLHVCSSRNPTTSWKHRIYNYEKTIYAGQSIKLYLVAKDIYLDKVQYASVLFSMGLVQSQIDSLSWHVAPAGVHEILHESGNCTAVTIALHKMTSFEAKSSEAALILSTPNDPSLVIVKLKFTKCPIGFNLSKQSGTCICSNVIYKAYGSYTTNCTIASDSPTITKPQELSVMWLGLVKLNNITVTGTSLTCIKYCNHRKGFDVFVVNTTHVMTGNQKSLENNILPLCPSNREGPLCSQCSPGYSVVFGSTECKKCSNWWILILIYYLVAGPIFIYLLYALNLTLTTGALHSIIFCSQILDIFLVDNNVNYATSSFELIHLYHQVVKTLFFTLNFSFNFPICFYNGMTELWKTGFSLIFPVYLLSIVIFLIIISRFSVKVSNRIAHSSVQVLVTVVHLSFAKLLMSLMIVFDSTDLYLEELPTMHVWYSDGAVKYGKDGHYILMIVTSLTVGPILCLYLVILLAGRILMRSNRLREYVRPIYEAIHAPFQHNKEFFFTARVILIIVLYTFYIIYRGHDIYAGYAIFVPLFFIFIAAESLCRPFKSMSLNYFSLILLSFALFACSTTWYFIKAGNTDGLALTVSLSATSVLVSLFGVIVYRVLGACGVLNKLKSITSLPKNIFQAIPRNRKLLIQEKNTSTNKSKQQYDEVREPLLLSEHVQYN